MYLKLYHMFFELCADSKTVFIYLLFLKYDLSGVKGLKKF